MGTKSARHIVEAALAAHLSAQTELAGVAISQGRFRRHERPA